MSTHLIEVNNLRKIYSVRKKEYLYAVNNLSFYIEEGETYGLVGESGCGKTTTGQVMLGLEKADGGSVSYRGKNLCLLKEKEFRPFRKELQMVFQNSLSALNPRKRIGDILEEILLVHGIKNSAKRRETVMDMLTRVGLLEEHYFRFPHELSGGQVQRLGIAGALIVKPKLIVCDEPVSALDVSIQAQILNMLVKLKKEMHLSLLFISHDIGVVRFISDRIGVMYLGTLVEEAKTENLFENPLHPYTKALFASVPDPYMKKKDFEKLVGEQQKRNEMFLGCAFCKRCPNADEKCRKEVPELREVEKGHKVACHYAK